jgi:transcriptional regulator with XRE-family HTH domain
MRIGEEDDMTRLKFYRLQAGLTQEEVARQLEVTQSALSLWERGINTPLAKYRKKLRALYHATDDELFGTEDNT